MTKIILHNLNQDSSHQRVIVNLASGYSTTQDNQDIKNNELTTQAEFSHALFSEKKLSKTGDYYCYTYDTMTDFFKIPKLIYATLIQSDSPASCQFKIKPSDAYIQLKSDYSIFFSVHHKKQAKESIRIQQLNDFISNISKFKFQYQDKVILDQVLTIKDLAETIDSDVLYQSDTDVAQFCMQIEFLDQYELRYINQSIGFGVFARNRINKGTLISQYCGSLVPGKIIDNSYVYKADPRGLNLGLDAREHGNISRFINHAPEQSFKNNRKLFTKTLKANINTKNQNVYGNNILMLIASRDIEKGEQLLSNYGPDFFTQSHDLLLIKRNGHVINYAGKIMQDTPAQRVQTLALMKHPSLKQAQWNLLIKPITVLLIMLLFLLVNKI